MDSRRRPIDDALLEKLGFNIGRPQHEQDLLELRQEVARLKAVVEMMADTVQALTARQQRTIVHH